MEVAEGPETRRKEASVSALCPIETQLRFDVKKSLNAHSSVCCLPKKNVQPPLSEVKHLKCVTKEISKNSEKKRKKSEFVKKRILIKVRNLFFHFYVKLEHWFVPFSVIVSVGNLL